MSLFSLIKRNWFLIGVVIVITLAKIAPEIGAKGGILKPEITVKYIAVFIIFFNSGISLKSEDLGRAVRQVRVHLFIQTFTFLFFPVLVYCLVSLLGLGVVNDNILEGLTILSCMPPPVSSAVILTKAVGGNEAAAIFNSAFGSFLIQFDLANSADPDERLPNAAFHLGLHSLPKYPFGGSSLQRGIGVTPALILFSVGSKASVPVVNIFLQLSATVVLPLLIGQWLRQMLISKVEIKRIPWGQIGSGILLVIIFAAFCDTFTHKDIDIDASSLFFVVFLILMLQFSLLYFVFYISSRRWMSFSRADTVALMFCCTHKSLTLGIPIIRIIFADYPGMSLISIPLLVYHPTQILLGGTLVPYVRKWMLEGKGYTSIGTATV